MIKKAFSLAVRLLICFVAAKLLLRALGWDTVSNLVLLTLVLLANIYWFDFLDYRECRYGRRRAKQGLSDIKAGDSHP